jgi:hypothetical protein
MSLQPRDAEEAVGQSVWGCRTYPTNAARLAIEWGIDNLQDGVGLGYLSKPIPYVVKSITKVINPKPSDIVRDPERRVVLLSSVREHLEIDVVETRLQHD